MVLTIIICASISIILLIILWQQDKENTKLTAENGVMKGRVEGINETTAEVIRQTQAQLEPLSMEAMAEAVRNLGYEPELTNETIRFKVSDDVFFIDGHRKPQVFVSRYYNVDVDEFDMPLLRQAAHLLSDDLIMVKAQVYEVESGTHLRFYICAIERNYPSFRDNLSDYLTLIKDGSNQMLEIYDRLVADKKDPSVRDDLAMPDSMQEHRVIS